MIRWFGRLLMIPYVWFCRGDVYSVGFVILSNILFWLAMRYEIRQFLELIRRKELPDQETLARLNGMGSVYRLSERFQISKLIRKLWP